MAAVPAAAAAAAAGQTRKEGKDLGHSPSEHMATGHLYGRLLFSGQQPRQSSDAGPEETRI